MKRDQSALSASKIGEKCPRLRGSENALPTVVDAEALRRGLDHIAMLDHLAKHLISPSARCNGRMGARSRAGVAGRFTYDPLPGVNGLAEEDPISEAFFDARSPKSAQNAPTFRHGCYDNSSSDSPGGIQPPQFEVIPSLGRRGNSHVELGGKVFATKTKKAYLLIVC